jgi:hypothetical protein
MRVDRMPLLPAAVLWTVGIAGAVALAALIRREHRRVNEELDQLRAAPAASKAERESHPTLKRDPHTGVFRP